MQRYDRYQLNAQIQRLSTIELTPQGSAWPFAYWGLDIEAIFPSYKPKEVIDYRGNYFTKWIETILVHMVFILSSSKFQTFFFPFYI